MGFSRPSNEEILAAAQETEAERDARLSNLFNKFDTKRTGKLYREQIEAGLQKLHVPSEHKFAQQLLLACDENHDGHCDLGEFKRHMHSKEQELYSLFRHIDANFDGSLTLAELKASLESAGIPTDSSHLQHLLQRMDADGNGSISFAEWRDMLLLFPHQATLQDLFRYWEKVCLVDIGEHAVIPEGIHAGQHHEAWRYLAAGAVAGAVSRTATAPLDRIRVVLQCQSVFTPREAVGALAGGSLAQGVPKGPNIPALPPGSSALRSAANAQPHAPGPAASGTRAQALPASPQRGFAAAKGGQQWALNGAFVGALSGSQGHLAAHSTEIAGGSTRILAAAATHHTPSLPSLPSRPPPLQGLASPLSLGSLAAQGAQPQLPQLRLAVQQVLREGGMGAFFKGNGLNVIKIGPESALKFFLYERLKETLGGGQGPGETPTQAPSALIKFVSGGMAGALAQAAIYPLDMLKTRIQTYKMSHGSPAPPASALFSSILRTEGPLALYRGLGPTLVGIFPYAGIDLALYETLKGSATALAAQRSKGEGGEVELNRAVQLLCGTVSGAVGAAAVYPLHVVRTRLQAIPTEAANAGSAGRLTALGMASEIWRAEGMRGFYVGLLPGLLKVAPAATITYGVYEHMKKLLYLE